MTFKEWWNKRPQGVMSGMQFAKEAYDVGYQSGVKQSLKNTKGLAEDQDRSGGQFDWRDTFYDEWNPKV